MVRIRTLVTAAALCLTAGSAHALPLVDIEAGARYWYANPGGEMAYNGRDLDVQDDLGFEKEWTPSFYARAAIPFVTLEVEHTDLSYTGSTGDRSFTFGNRNFTASGQDTSFDMTMLHGSAMFSVPLPVVDIGLGLGATRLDAEGKVGNETATAEVTLPVAKAEARVDFPLIPLIAVVKANGIGYDGNNYRDVTAEIGYQMGPLQIRGGYREVGLKYDDNSSDLVMDAQFSGPFGGLTLAF
ncbi:TIGR04219 family outer membrane beta-barrel protein [Thiohalorhabdus methylotrophus]|uniref:TIGR04219 family outer membrane beta-barrel protein n=1 Tax=Thiohalorhabdus methylotrophus TaxID=3242694 RepID=A0ABV4TUX6_9GAMM